MKNLTLFCLGMSLLVACRKDDVVVCVDDASASFATYQNFMRRNSAPQQTFTFDLANPRVITTAAGATITLPANAFQKPDGTPATGQAELRFRELYTAADFLLADMPTSDLKSISGVPTPTLLVSGGEFKLQVWQGNERLRMRAVIATSSPSVMTMVSPMPSIPDTAQVFGMTTWSLALPAAIWTNTNTPVQPSFTATNKLSFTSSIRLDSLSWWNIDQLWNQNPTAPRTFAEFSFDTDRAASTFTRTWLKPTTGNALFQTYLSSTSTGADLLALPNVPVGSNLTAIVLQFRADGLYYGTKTATTQANVTPHVTLTKLSEAQVLQRIRQL